MSKLKYKTSKWGTKIIKIKVERETPASVFLMNGRRALKKTQYERYHDTLLDAKSYLLSLYKQRLESAEISVILARKNLDFVETTGLK